jgi:hypothetical protein
MFMYQKKHIVFLTSTKILMESGGKSLLLLISYETNENCVCVCVCVNAEFYNVKSRGTYIYQGALYG